MIRSFFTTQTSAHENDFADKLRQLSGKEDEAAFRTASITPYSETVCKKKIVDAIFKQICGILERNKELIDKWAKVLLELETLDEAENLELTKGMYKVGE